jgi:hypothetical protein
MIAQVFFPSGTQEQAVGQIHNLIRVYLANHPELESSPDHCATLELTYLGETLGQKPGVDLVDLDDPQWRWVLYIHRAVTVRRVSPDEKGFAE